MTSDSRRSSTFVLRELSRRALTAKTKTCECRLPRFLISGSSARGKSYGGFQDYSNYICRGVLDRRHICRVCLHTGLRTHRRWLRPLQISTDRPGSPTVPNLGESSHHTIPPSLDGPALAPAPKDLVHPQWTPMLGGLMPEAPGSPIEPRVDPAIPATSPMLTVPPSSMSRPGGGFYAPVR